MRHGEDRICTTAMAFNALLYSWTVDGRFISNTPPAVMDVLSRAGQWLAQNVFSGKFEPFCVTFSGSVKSYIVSVLLYCDNLGQDACKTTPTKTSPKRIWFKGVSCI